MNILILSAEFPPFNVGGISIHTYETCKYLAVNNWNVCVLTFQPNKEISDFEYSHMDDIEVYRVPRPTHIEDDYQKSYANQNVQIKIGVLNLFNDNRSFDLIVVHGYFLAEATLYAKDVFKAPIVYHSHTDYGLNVSMVDRATNVGTLSHAFERLLCNECHSIVAVSDYLKNLLNSNFGQASKTSIIPKGLHIDAYDNALNAKKIKTVKDFKIIFVGRISVDKGIEVLLNAVAIAKKTINHRIIIYVVGTAINQEYLDLIKSMIKELGLQSNVVFLGYKDQSEITQIYCECDIAVVPSYGETFGKVAIEAMAAKLPIIVSDIGGLGELVDQGVTGLKFEVGNAEELSGYIVKLWSDDALYKSLSNEGYRVTIKLYDINGVFERTNKIYLDAVSS